MSKFWYYKSLRNKLVQNYTQDTMLFDCQSDKISNLNLKDIVVTESNVIIEIYP